MPSPSLFHNTTNLLQLILLLGYSPSLSSPQTTCSLTLSNAVTSYTQQPKHEATSLHILPTSHFLPYRNTLDNQARKLLTHSSEPAFEDGFSLLVQLAGTRTVNNASTYDPRSSTCGPVRSGHLDSSEARGDHTPQPSRVICTHLRAKTQPPGLQCWAHPTAHVDGHVPPSQQPHVHMPALLVMQRPHVTTSALKRA